MEITLKGILVILFKLCLAGSFGLCVSFIVPPSWSFYFAGIVGFLGVSIVEHNYKKSLDV